MLIKSRSEAYHPFTTTPTVSADRQLPPTLHQTMRTEHTAPITKVIVALVAIHKIKKLWGR